MLSKHLGPLHPQKQLLSHLFRHQVPGIDIASETDLEGNWTAVSIYSQTAVLKTNKQRWIPFAEWLVGNREERARFARFPGQRRLRRRRNLHF